jgi:hypothetical protein
MLEPLYRNVIAVAFVALIVVGVVDVITTRSSRRLWIWAVCMALAFLLLRSVIDFPAARVPNAGGIPLPVAISVLFVSTAAGIAANYIFYVRRRFSWMAVIRPLCVTPIVLLPVLASLGALDLVSPTQLVSFSFLSFQNGFFWRTVLEHAKTKVA